MKLDLVLFDLDGTLLDTFPAILNALKQAHLKYIGGTFSVPLEELRETVSLGLLALVEKTLGANHPLLEEACIETEYIYESIMLNQTNYFEGIQDVLSYLISINMRFGIVTSKPKKSVSVLCDKNELLRQTSVIICPEDVKNIKPNPEPLITACKRMGIEIDSAIYIGDSNLDIEAANKCKMPSILVLYGYLSNQTDPSILKPTYIANSPSEIITLIKSITSAHLSSNFSPCSK